jgi:hypothetical protein
MLRDWALAAQSQHGEGNAQIRAGFGEGFATADLNEAKLLLVVEGRSGIEPSTFSCAG